MTYSHKATGRFTVTSWSETVETDIDGAGTTRGEVYCPNRGVTRAAVSFAYTGEIEGTSTVAYLISDNGNSAPVLGFERFEGSIAGRTGTCVLQRIGEQDAVSVTEHISVVPGMGTGELETLRGEADIRIAGHTDDGYELSLAFDAD